MKNLLHFSPAAQTAFVFQHNAPGHNPDTQDATPTTETITRIYKLNGEEVSEKAFNANRERYKQRVQATEAGQTDEAHNYADGLLGELDTDGAVINRVYKVNGETVSQEAYENYLNTPVDLSEENILADDNNRPIETTVDQPQPTLAEDDTTPIVSTTEEPTEELAEEDNTPIESTTVDQPQPTLAEDDTTPVRKSRVARPTIRSSADQKKAQEAAADRVDMQAKTIDRGNVTADNILFQDEDSNSIPALSHVKNPQTRLMAMRVANIVGRKIAQDVEQGVSTKDVNAYIKKANDAFRDKHDARGDVFKSIES